MKKTKKLLGFFLTLAVTVGLLFANTSTAKAYSYSIRICLGNNENASFVSENVEEITEKLKESGITVHYYKMDDGENDSETLVFSGFDYDDTLTVDLNSLVNIEQKSDATNYYVKGLRMAGGSGDPEKDILSGGKNPTLNVIGEQTYVLAYGVGATVPYLVRYEDQKGNALADEEIQYGAVGEVIVVPAKAIAGYKAEHKFLTDSRGIQEPEKVTDAEGKETTVPKTVFTFKYKKYDPNTVYNEDVQYSTSYSETAENVNGGGTTYVRRNNGNGGGQAAGNAGGGNGGAAAADNAGGEAAGNAEQPVVEPTPEPEVYDIADEDVARAGGEPQDNLVRNMIVAIIIAIIAVLAILIALIVADRKRKAQIANTNRKDDNE